MNMILPISKVRKDIFGVTNAARDGAYVTITEHGEAKAVLMSAEEFASWRETLAVMRELPDIGTDLESAKRAVKGGSYKRYSLMAPYVSHPSRAARGKRVR